MTVEPWVIPALERIAQDYEARAMALARKGDYDAQFPESEAQAVRIAIAKLTREKERRV